MLKLLNNGTNEFLKDVKDKTLICYGAGKNFDKVMTKYSEKHLVEKVEFIVDGNCDLWGTIKKIADCEIKIVSLDDLIAYVSGNKDIVLLITNYNNYIEILETLDNFIELDGIHTYVGSFLHIKLKTKKFKLLQKENIVQLIPKVIHYCWFGGNPLPEESEKCIESWKKHCPDYKIVRWDENNYDVTKNQYMKEAYEAKKWAFVSDYARLDIINNYGGIYLDTDVELLKPFDDLLGYDLFCGFESDEYVNLGLGFGAKANSPILKEMMLCYEQMRFVKDDGSLNLVTCPIIQTQVLKKYGLKCDGSYQELGNTGVFPSEFFSPYNSIGLGQITENTFSIHKYAATWFDDIMLDNREKFSNDIKHLLTRIQQ